MRKTLTQEQATQSIHATTQLVELATAQLEEHKQYLQQMLTKHLPAGDSLIAEVVDIKLGAVKIDLVNGAWQITTLYDWPDSLVAYLQRSDLPKDLRVLQNAVILQDESPVKV